MISEERRKFPRLLLNVGVEYIILDEADSTAALTSSKNISAGGLCIILLEPLCVGTQLELSFLLPEDENMIKAQCRVVWSREFIIGEGAGQAKGYESGIEFINISAGERNTISKYISNRQ